MRHATEVTSRYALATDAPSGSMLAYAMYRFIQKDPYAAEAFVIDLAEKVGLKKGDPVLSLVKKFQEIRRRRERVPKQEQLSMLFRTWNARRRGDTMVMIRTKIEGKNIPIPDLE